jgi:hypothetical protein
MAASMLVRRGDYNLLISNRVAGHGSRSPRAARSGALLEGNAMNLPKIDISSLPNLDTLTGMFGSLSHYARVSESDDTIIVMMVFVYDVINSAN